MNCVCVCVSSYVARLATPCQKVIKSVTEDESRYIELNPEVAKACKQIIKQNCMVSVAVWVPPQLRAAHPLQPSADVWRCQQDQRIVQGDWMLIDESSRWLGYAYDLTLTLLTGQRAQFWTVLVFDVTLSPQQHV